MQKVLVLAFLHRSSKYSRTFEWSIGNEGSQAPGQADVEFTKRLRSFPLHVGLAAVRLEAAAMGWILEYPLFMILYASLALDYLLQTQIYCCKAHHCTVI